MPFRSWSAGSGLIPFAEPGQVAQPVFVAARCIPHEEADQGQGDKESNGYPEFD